MADRDNKGNSLELALAQIEKQFGKGAIMRLGEEHILGVEDIVAVAGYSVGKIYVLEYGGTVTLWTSPSASAASPRAG